EGVRTVLSTLGELPRGGTAALKHRLAERREQRQRRWIEPVHVLWDGHPFHVPLRLPERSGAGPLQWRLREESGRTHEGRLTPDDLPVQAQGRGESCRVLPLPSELPWGYHDLQLNLGSE